MKYFIIISSNGNVTVNSEWSNLNSAKVAYHDVCKIYWNASDVLKGFIAIVDEQLDTVQGYKEFISHPAPEPEVPEEPETPVEE